MKTFKEFKKQNTLFENMIKKVSKLYHVSKYEIKNNILEITIPNETDEIEYGLYISALSNFLQKNKATVLPKHLDYKYINSTILNHQLKQNNETFSIKIYGKEINNNKKIFVEINQQ